MIKTTSKYANLTVVAFTGITGAPRPWPPRRRRQGCEYPQRTAAQLISSSWLFRGITSQSIMFSRPLGARSAFTKSLWNL